MKNKKNTNNKKRKSQLEIVKDAVNTSKKKNMENLSSKLDGIYNEVNLETTQTCKCHCCQVAMPQISYGEFINIATSVWDNSSEKDKLHYIKTSIEYFFRYEFEKWGISSLVKPCMFLQDDGKCGIYEKRPLSCRMFGLWPQEMYDERVENFSKIYSEYGLEISDLPLHKQCKSVKRKSEDVELNREIVEGLYEKLHHLDKSIGDFTDLQIETKENVRTFHDWLLMKVFGEDWLELMTTFVLAAEREVLEAQFEAIWEALDGQNFSKVF